jgi:hypothetical protein
MDKPMRILLAAIVGVLGAAVVSGVFIYASVVLGSRNRIDKLEDVILELRNLNNLYTAEQVLQASELRKLQVEMADMLLLRERFAEKGKSLDCKKCPEDGK